MNPAVVTIRGYTIYWYGLLYVLGVTVAAVLLPRLQRYRSLSLTADQQLAMLTWAFAGIVIGGRFGYVVLYEPRYFLSHPSELLLIGNGGMASHGGFIGVALALWLFCRAYRMPLLALADVLVVPAGIGLALGRVGNFINGELGTWWPLFEAGSDVFIAGVSLWLLTKKTAWPAGRLTAFFLVAYSVARFILEFWRPADHPLIMLGSLNITQEQLATLLLVAGGLFLWHTANDETREHRF